MSVCRLHHSSSVVSRMRSSDSVRPCSARSPTSPIGSVPLVGCADGPFLGGLWSLRCGARPTRSPYDPGQGRQQHQAVAVLRRWAAGQNPGQRLHRHAKNCMPWTNQECFEACERIAVEVGNVSVRSLDEELGRADRANWATPCGSGSVPGPSSLSEAYPRGAVSVRGHELALQM